MRRNVKQSIKLVLIFLAVFSAFVGFGYFYLNDNSEVTNNVTSSIPYKPEPPQNAGILLTINGDETFFYLDFFNEKITVSLKPEEPFNNEIYGYSFDYKIESDSSLISYVVDYVGGIDLKVENQDLRLTGEQVKALYDGNVSLDFKKEIIEVLAGKFTQTFVGVEFFSDIINATQTDLKIIDCYFWDDYFNKVCNNLHFIE
jgi:hypothetical protein